MQAGESEEENGVGQSSGHSAVQGLPWWGGIGHHPLHTTSSSPAKLSYIENPSLVTATARPLGLIHPTTMQQAQGQSLSQTFSEGQGTNLVAPPVQSLSHSDYVEGGGINHHQESAAPGVFATLPGEYLFPHTQLELGPSMAGAVYPYADPYFGGIVAAYGAQAMIHPHMLGVQQARMPLPSEEVEEEPVYVNAKQYHGILRRRQSRAKAESENKLIKSRKPYLHESRHLHAMKRARGCGGRFLNKKSKESKSNTDSNKSSEGQSSQGGNTPDSHAIQLEHSVPGSQDTYAQTEQGLRGQAAARRAQPGLSGVSYYPETFSHGGHPMMSSGTVHGGYHSHQNQKFHSPAFQPSPAASDEGDSGRSGDIMSNGSQ